MEKYYYECNFLFVSDTSEFSANIPDASAFTCLIESDIDLDKLMIPSHILFDDIQEYLGDKDRQIITDNCETIRLQRIGKDEIPEYEGVGIELIKIDTDEYKTKYQGISKE